MQALKLTVNKGRKVISVTSGTLVIREAGDWPVKGQLIYDKGLKRWRLDAKGWTLNASRHRDNVGPKKKRVDDEGRYPALRLKLPGLMVWALRVVGSPNGVAIGADRVKLVGMRFEQVGEDALNLHGVKGCEIIECFFSEGTDKLLQANGSVFYVHGCRFSKCTNAIRVMGGEMTGMDAVVFDGCDTAVHVTRDGVARRGAGNVYRGVKKREKVETGGRFAAVGA